MVASPFTLKEQEALTEAIAAFERETSAELVVVVAEQSDSYMDIAYSWSLAISSLVVWGLWFGHLLHAFPALWMTQGIAFLVALIFLQEGRFSAKLAPKNVQMKHARFAAAAQFTLKQMTQTTGKTGIMLYISLAEHYAEIRADQSVNQSVSEDIWDRLLSPLIRAIPEHGLAHALQDMIRESAATLKPYLPRQTEDVNELPNTVQFV